ncbi:MAG: tRNA (adenosine(37)-N6)-threonylcarbamoyltransferase complex ATPase subunit type 1 TsaE, partial [bacterium]
AYRLKNEKELLHLGWEEIINNKENLVFIEWPENVTKVVPSNTKFVEIFHAKDGGRVFKF